MRDRLAERLESQLKDQNKAAFGYPMRPCQPRPDGQEVTRPCSETIALLQDAFAGAFMHSDCALARASPDIPAVCLLHIDILLSGLADKHVFMNALRSSPVLPSALTLQAFIFSCCAFGAAAGAGVAAVVAVAAGLAAAGVAVSAANAGAAAAIAHAATRINILFMGFSK